MSKENEELMLNQASATLGMVQELRDIQKKMQIENSRRIQLLNDLVREQRLQHERINKFLEKNFTDQDAADWWKKARGADDES